MVGPNGMVSNGFGYGVAQPPVGYTPQVTGYQYNPGMQPVQPQPAVESTATVSDSQPQVNQKFEK